MGFIINTVLFNGKNSTAGLFDPADIIGNYNRPNRYFLGTGNSLNISSDSVHSLSFKQVSGSGTISINGVTPQVVSAGEFDSWTASKLLDNDFDFECTSGVMVITTIGPA